MSELEDFISNEQTSLWSDLSEAIRYANNGVWSMAASNVAQRIVAAARLVGPTPNGACPWDLVAGGVYEAVLAAGGISVEMPDEAEWQRLDVLMAEHGGTRETLRPKMAATVAAIQSPRETAWISEGEDSD